MAFAQDDEEIDEIPHDILHSGTALVGTCAMGRHGLLDDSSI